MKFRTVLSIMAAFALFSAVLVAGEGKSVQGELISVNPDSQTLVVRDASGSQMEFKYNESTEISGTDGTIAGLAGEAGTTVKVDYRAEAGSNVATRIQVQKQQDRSQPEPSQQPMPR